MRRRLVAGELGAWSPDGTRLAVIQNSMPPPGHIVVVPATGGAGVDLGEGDDPVWSPDGKRIAFSDFPNGTQQGGTGQLYVVNADGTGRRQLTPETSSSASPFAWSRDGQQVAFTSFAESNGKVSIEVINADGSNPHAVFSGPSPNSPNMTEGGGDDWSHATNTILLTSQDDLYSVHPDGAGLRRLTDTPSVWKTAARWSPDGTQISFVGGFNPSGPSELSVMNADGTGLRQIARATSTNGATWSPDGSRLTFAMSQPSAAGSTPEPALYTIAPDGTHLFQAVAPITQPGAGVDENATPQWGPKPVP
jgi:Tol biopolymer transport system component